MSEAKFIKCVCMFAALTIFSYLLPDIFFFFHVYKAFNFQKKSTQYSQWAIWFILSYVYFSMTLVYKYDELFNFIFYTARWKKIYVKQDIFLFYIYFLLFFSLLIHSLFSYFFTLILFETKRKNLIFNEMSSLFIASFNYSTYLFRLYVVFQYI